MKKKPKADAQTERLHQIIRHQQDNLSEAVSLAARLRADKARILFCGQQLLAGLKAVQALSPDEHVDFLLTLVIESAKGEATFGSGLHDAQVDEASIRP